MNTIVIIGSGYVGLVTGACLAEAGHRVTCVDRDRARVASLRAGHIPFYEPGLAELVDENVKAGRLLFGTDVAEAIPGADAVFIAVGTPPRKDDGEADISQVLAVAEDIASCLDGFMVIVNKSTVPVGMAANVETLVRQINPSADFAVVSNPEFLREGTAIQDFTRPDRVVIGSADERATSVMQSIYAPFVAPEKIMVTDPVTSELVKYAANAFLALKLSFINEMADLSEAIGADIIDVARGIGLDRRIGLSYLKAGPGYGGSCFPKDTLALASSARRRGSPLKLVEATIAVNEARKRKMADRIEAAAGHSLAGKRIGVLGLTFKPDTDDMRESPSLVILPELIRRGAIVQVHDPVGLDAAITLMPDLQPCALAESVAINADVLLVMTEWACYRDLDLAALARSMKNPVLVDLRNLFDPVIAAQSGFGIIPLGRPARGLPNPGLVFERSEKTGPLTFAL